MPFNYLMISVGMRCTGQKGTYIYKCMYESYVILTVRIDTHCSFLYMDGSLQKQMPLPFGPEHCVIKLTSLLGANKF